MMERERGERCLLKYLHLDCFIKIVPADCVTDGQLFF